MNKVKKTLLTSIYPHISDEPLGDDKNQYEINLQHTLDSLYQSFYRLVRDAYEEGVYTKGVEWEQDFLEWIEKLDID
jgi:hypothetical protein